MLDRKLGGVFHQWLNEIGKFCPLRARASKSRFLSLWMWEQEQLSWLANNIQLFQRVRSFQGTWELEENDLTTIRESLSSHTFFQFKDNNFSIAYITAQSSASRQVACPIFWESPLRNWASLLRNTPPIAPQEGEPKADPSMFILIKPSLGRSHRIPGEPVTAVGANVKIVWP